MTVCPYPTNGFNQNNIAHYVDTEIGLRSNEINQFYPAESYTEHLSFAEELPSTAGPHRSMVANTYRYTVFAGKFVSPYERYDDDNYYVIVNDMNIMISVLAPNCNDLSVNYIGEFPVGEYMSNPNDPTMDFINMNHKRNLIYYSNVYVILTKFDSPDHEDFREHLLKGGKLLAVENCGPRQSLNIKLDSFAIHQSEKIVVYIQNVFDNIALSAFKQFSSWNSISSSLDIGCNNFVVNLFTRANCSVAFYQTVEENQEEGQMEEDIDNEDNN